MRFIITLLVNGFLVLVITRILSGVQVDSFLTALIVGFVLTIVNFFIRPVLTLLTLPITILTLGLFLLVINGLMVLLVDRLVEGFAVDSLITAILFSVSLSSAWSCWKFSVARSSG